MVALKKFDKSKCVVVFLAMNTQKDDTYGRDARSMLERSLDLFYKNYNDKFKHDVIIFHDPKFEFLEKDQEEIKKGRTEIKFHLLSGDKWAPPNIPEVMNSDPNKWVGGKSF